MSTIGVVIINRDGVILQTYSEQLDYRCTDNTMVEIMATKKAVSLMADGRMESRMEEERSHITIAVIGNNHEGSGKSTTTGHLVLELGGIDKSLIGKYEEETAAMSSRPLKYRWVLDTLKANKECVKFKSNKYDCTVVDSLDYSDFKQAVTNTYQADCAILMTDSTAETGMDYSTLIYAKHLR